MPQTHHNLTNFLVKMANDSHALASFERDPDAAIQAAGLSTHDAAIVKSRDPKKIGAAVTAGFLPAMLVAPDHAGYHDFLVIRGFGDLMP